MSSKSINPGISYLEAPRDWIFLEAAAALPQEIVVRFYATAGRFAGLDQTFTLPREPWKATYNLDIQGGDSPGSYEAMPTDKFCIIRGNMSGRSFPVGGCEILGVGSDYQLYPYLFYNSFDGTSWPGWYEGDGDPTGHNDNDWYWKRDDGSLWTKNPIHGWLYWGQSEPGPFTPSTLGVGPEFTYQWGTEWTLDSRTGFVMNGDAVIASTHGPGDSLWGVNVDATLIQNQGVPCQWRWARTTGAGNLELTAALGKDPSYLSGSLDAVWTFGVNQYPADEFEPEPDTASVTITDFTKNTLAEFVDSFTETFTDVYGTGSDLAVDLTIS